MCICVWFLNCLFFLFLRRWIQILLLVEELVAKMMRETCKLQTVTEWKGMLLKQVKLKGFSQQDQTCGWISQGLRRTETGAYATTARRISRVSPHQGHQTWGSIMKFARNIRRGKLAKLINRMLLTRKGSWRRLNSRILCLEKQQTRCLFWDNCL